MQCSNYDQRMVYNNCKFPDFWGRGFCARRGHISHIYKDQTNLVYSNNDVKMVYRTLEFLDPRGRGLFLGHGQIRHIVRMLNFSKVRQTKYITMMNKKGSTKTMNFITSGYGLC